MSILISYIDSMYTWHDVVKMYFISVVFFTKTNDSNHNEHIRQIPI